MTINNLYPLVELKNIRVAFDTQNVFSNASLTILRQQHIAFVGANGIGKSTLLKLISGELRLAQRNKKNGSHENGVILWNFTGRLESSALEAKKNIRLVSPSHQTTYVRQGWRVTGEEILLSGYENTPLLYGKMPQSSYDAVHAFAQEAGLEHLLSMTVPTMSQGQLRSILLMRAMIVKPALLVLDEPLDGLDIEARATLLYLMELAGRNGSTLVFTAHRKEDIPSFVKQCLTIENGLIVPLASGKPDALNVANIDMPLEQAISSFVGLDQYKKKIFDSLGNSETILELKNVDVYIDRKKILHKINWSIHKGENWILSGSNGSGKSTLIKTLYGQEFVADGGNLFWFDRENIPLPDLHKLVGYVSDSLQNAYEYDCTVEKVILSGFDGSIGLYREEEQLEKKIAIDWMEILGLTDLAYKNFQSLSTGQARRVLLARALVGAPPVMLLDEPFSGLDEASRKCFLNIFPFLVSIGVQLIFVSHRLNDYAEVFSHELKLNNGRIVFSGPVSS